MNIEGDGDVMVPGLGSLVVATYLLQDKREKLEQRAESIAVGLTVGSWTDLPASMQSSVQPHRGTVEGIEVIEERPGGQVQARVSIGYPVVNLTPQIAALTTTVFGKLSMDGMIRLVGLDIPKSYLVQFPGPKFGVDGIRKLTGVTNRPFLMSIFKTCVGQSLEDLTLHFRDQALGGPDFIKDDEIFFTETYATPEARVEAYRLMADKVQAQTGHKVRYAVNLTGPVLELRDRARRLVELGADLLLFNTVAYGYDLLAALAADEEVHVPIMAHPAVAGALYASPDYGIASDIVLGQLMRMAGADIVIYPSPYGSVTLPREEGMKLVDALRRENELKTSLPAPSAGIHPGLVPTLVADLGIDCVVNAGGGIHGHPGGATAGGQAFRAAIDATLKGTPLSEAAKQSLVLSDALKRWGGGEQ